MACERNRIIELSEYLNSLGIEVNIGMNKARGNKGFFCAKRGNFRIDIAKNLSNEEIFSILIHEFAHFIHYSYDKTLKSLDFIIQKQNNDITEELLALTVESISKKNIKPLFEQKENTSTDIKNLVRNLKQKYSDFQQNKDCSEIEKKITKSGLRYLLKHDAVRCFENFQIKTYDIRKLDSMEIDSDIKNYILLKSKQRLLKRINSKISRINKYYNTPAELFARSVETYILQPELMQSKAPQLNLIYEQCILSNRIPILTSFINLCSKG